MALRRPAFRTARCGTLVEKVLAGSNKSSCACQCYSRSKVVTNLPMSISDVESSETGSVLDLVVIYFQKLAISSPRRHLSRDCLFCQKAQAVYQLFSSLSATEWCHFRPGRLEMYQEALPGGYLLLEMLHWGRRWLRFRTIERQLRLRTRLELSKPNLTVL
jgi:hypothetical protein